MRLVVLISGGGTNLQAIMDAITAGKLNAEIALVVSNRKAAYGLQRAEKAGIETLYFPRKPYSDQGKARSVYDSDLAERISAYQPDLIVLAGWMHIFSKAFLDVFPNRVINLHPALPGTFPGTDAIRRAYDEAQGTDEIVLSGVMMHYVVPEVDAGDPIVQAEVPIMPDDSLEEFEARMHAAEHQVIVTAIALLAAQYS